MKIYITPCILVLASLVTICGLMICPVAAGIVHLTGSGDTISFVTSSQDTSRLASMINSAVSRYSGSPTQFSGNYSATTSSFSAYTFDNLDGSSGALLNLSETDMFGSTDTSFINEDWDDLFSSTSTASGCSCGSS